MSTQAQELHEAAVDFRFALVAVLVVLLVVALALWPLGGGALALDVARSAGLFFAATWLVYMALAFIHERLKINLYDHANAFVYSNLGVGGVLLAGWTAYAALAVGAAAAGAPLWRAAILYAAGLLAGHVGYGIVTAFWNGRIYRYTLLPFMAAAYVLFALWPPAARFLFGWLFRLL